MVWTEAIHGDRSTNQFLIRSRNSSLVAMEISQNHAIAIGNRDAPYP